MRERKVGWRFYFAPKRHTVVSDRRQSQAVRRTMRLTRRVQTAGPTSRRDIQTTPSVKTFRRGGSKKRSPCVIGRCAGVRLAQLARIDYVLYPFSKRTHKPFEDKASSRGVALLCHGRRSNRYNSNNSRRMLESPPCGLLAGKSLMYWRL